MPRYAVGTSSAPAGVATPPFRVPFVPHQCSTLVLSRQHAPANRSSAQAVSLATLPPSSLDRFGCPRVLRRCGASAARAARAPRALRSSSHARAPRAARAACNPARATDPRHRARATDTDLYDTNTHQSTTNPLTPAHGQKPVRGRRMSAHNHVANTHSPRQKEHACGMCVYTERGGQRATAATRGAIAQPQPARCAHTTLPTRPR